MPERLGEFQRGDRDLRFATSITSVELKLELGSRGR